MDLTLRNSPISAGPHLAKTTSFHARRCYANSEAACAFFAEIFKVKNPKKKT